MSVQTIETFGPDGRLAGILSGDPRAGGPVLVLPNAGLVPRAGPFRLHVDIARRLEQAGVRTFRFDLPGAGEAPFIGGVDGSAATRLALDHLAARGIGDRFVVGGLCSAADRGWIAAGEDPRVRGVLMVDGICYKGPWYHLAFVRDTLARSPAQWHDALRRRIDGVEVEPPTALFRGWPRRAQMRAELGAMLERDVRLLLVYTGGIREYLRDARQFRWSFGRGIDDPRASLHYWPDCDHTFYSRAARERLLDAIETWFTATFGDAGVHD